MSNCHDNCASKQMAVKLIEQAKEREKNAVLDEAIKLIEGKMCGKKLSLVDLGLSQAIDAINQLKAGGGDEPTR